MGALVKARPIIFDGESVRAILDGRKKATRRVMRLPYKGALAKLAMDDIQSWHQDASGGWIGWSSDGSDLAGFTKRAYPSGGIRCPYGAPGDELWVKEAWQFYDWTEEGDPCIRYKSDEAIRWPSTKGADPDRLADIWAELSAIVPRLERAADRKWRSPLHMPRWASRLTLRVTDVRVERLQEISGSDAVAEGVTLTVRTRPDGSRAPLLCISAYPMPHEFSVKHPKDWDEDDYWRHAFARRWEAINAKRGLPWTANPWVWVVTFERLAS